MTQQHHLNHATWDCKSCGFHTEVPEKSGLRKNQRSNLGCRVPLLGRGAGNAGSRRAI